MQCKSNSTSKLIPNFFVNNPISFPSPVVLLRTSHAPASIGRAARAAERAAWHAAMSLSNRAVMQRYAHLKRTQMRSWTTSRTSIVVANLMST
jgi:hypothetical protein